VYHFANILTSRFFGSVNFCDVLKYLAIYASCTFFLNVGSILICSLLVVKRIGLKIAFKSCEEGRGEKIKRPANSCLCASPCIVAKTVARPSVFRTDLRNLFSLFPNSSRNAENLSLSFFCWAFYYLPFPLVNVCVWGFVI